MIKSDEFKLRRRLVYFQFLSTIKSNLLSSKIAEFMTYLITYTKL